jgi:hypothetical protein
MPRPGNVVDYILENAGADGTISVRKLWKALIEGLEGVWPEDTRTHMRRGDVWGYTPLKTIGVPGSDMLPFHKLTQWLAYSMLEPIEQLGLRVTDIDLLTALSEYRNGGFVLDIGLLQVSLSALSAAHWSHLNVEAAVFKQYAYFLLNFTAQETGRAHYARRARPRL